MRLAFVPAHGKHDGNDVVGCGDVIQAKRLHPIYKYAATWKTQPVGLEGPLGLDDAPGEYSRQDLMHGASLLSGKITYLGLGDLQIICHSHNDGVGKRTGVEGNGVVVDDRPVHVKLERGYGRAERWHGSGNKISKLEQLFPGGKAEFLSLKSLLDRYRVYLQCRAHNEKLEFGANLHDDRLAADLEVFSPRRRRCFGGVSWFVMNLAV